VISGHVEQRTKADGSAKKVWSLCNRSAHQQTSIGATANRQLAACCALFAEKPLGGSDKVIERPLSLFSPAGDVPRLAELRAAPYGGYGEQKALFDKEGCERREPRGHTNTETPIRGEKRWQGARVEEILSGCQEKRYRSSVF
jgi:hypothetical protein